MTIDPNLWASLARQYSGGVAMPVTGQAGYVAIVNADANNLEFVKAPPVTIYTSKASVKYAAWTTLTVFFWDPAEHSNSALWKLRALMYAANASYPAQVRLYSAGAPIGDALQSTAAAWEAPEIALPSLPAGVYELQVLSDASYYGYFSSVYLVPA